MYLVGADHPNKFRASALVSKYANLGVPLVTDAKVYQEIVHRYSAINRREVIQMAFDVLDAAVVEVVGINRTTIEKAKDILLAHPSLTARDCVHVAVMRDKGIREILTFDSHFASLPGITVIS